MLLVILLLMFAWKEIDVLKRLGLLLVVVLVVGACGAGPHAVQEGALRDTIFAVETKQNGSYFVWMTHDDAGVYCTMDSELFAKAEAIFNDKSKSPEVFLKYISANVGSAENPDLLQSRFGTAGCSHEQAVVYVMTDISAVSEAEPTAVSS